MTVLQQPIMPEKKARKRGRNAIGYPEKAKYPVQPCHQPQSPIWKSRVEDACLSFFTHTYRQHTHNNQKAGNSNSSDDDGLTTLEQISRLKYFPTVQTALFSLKPLFGGFCGAYPTPTPSLLLHNLDIVLGLEHRDKRQIIDLACFREDKETGRGSR